MNIYSYNHNTDPAMYPYIICFCGHSLGEIYDLYCAMRDDIYIEAYSWMAEEGIDFSLLPILDAKGAELHTVFESLHIHADCCRARLLTQVMFEEI